jgi:Fe-S-cluster containining protein
VSEQKLVPIENPQGLSDRERLKLVGKLNRRLPTTGFECKPDCGKCCETPVEMLAVEWFDLQQREPAKSILAKLKAEKIDIYVESRTDTALRVSTKFGCPFLDRTTKKCGIYDLRPFVCRAYGQHWFLRCKEGVASTNDLTDKQFLAWAALADKVWADPPKFTALRAEVEAWREGHQDRLDRIPTPMEMDKFRAERAAKA